MAFTVIHLHQLTIIFGILGNIVSFGVFLAPLPTFWRIFKKKSTLGFQSIPYSVALFSSMLLLYYAFLKETNGTMILTINTIGCAIEGAYLIVYLIYATKESRVYTAKLLGLFNVGFFGVIVLTTMLFVRGTDKHSMFSKGGMRVDVVGWICGIFSVCVFAAPLSVMRMVIKTKSVEFMPFGLSVSLTLCAIIWFFYGFLIKDFYIALPNILGFAFGIVQMILYVIYNHLSKKRQNSNKIGDDLMIKKADIIQLQELAININLGKIEPQNKPAEVIEIILEEMVDVNNNDNEDSNNIVNEVDKKAANGEVPRGDNAC
ncbi:hypothetical protein SOVF_095750 [Spinacia oleracea]|uniref:Bidirectional sugar transporter SWEET n=1 Tax=Spinacia oleracea TaxID=3562 RepID=A0A9R0IMS0_SPIOL|nr:bidirectional sugar transporter SWEET9-like [Spinacia oleracea]KNA15692.1 hypothetical protein SOVF_095750 [Spinacia oleracea]